MTFVTGRCAVTRTAQTRGHLDALGAGGAGGRKTTGASTGTLNGVADFGSESNLENVVGLSLKCLSSVVTRVLLAG